LLSEQRILESVRDFLGGFRLPRRLTLTLAGCNGVVEAFYEPETAVVTVCYEYAEHLEQHAPAGTADGVSRDDAVIGPTMEAFLHEAGHALFHLLDIPVLGREEDAADQFAAYALLQLGAEEARRAIAGVAHMLVVDARTQTLAPDAFASVHGLPQQRHYNLLCMAYGAHPELFADMAVGGKLPAERRETCAEEFNQVKHAYAMLLAPHAAPRAQAQPSQWRQFTPQRPGREKAKY
jgi:hypothetical protein